MTIAIKAFNTILQYVEPISGTDFLTVAEVTTLGYGFNDVILPVTSHDSVQPFIEKIKGLLDEGEVPMEVNYVPGNTTHQQVLTDRGVTRSWRIVLPNYSANSIDVQTVSTAGDTLLLISNHGYTEAQPVKLVTTGVLPTSSPQLVTNNLYYARPDGVDIVELYLTSADALAEANIIDLTTAGSGTHSVLTGSPLTFTAFVSAVGPAAPVDGALTASITLTVTGQSTYPS